MDEVKARFHMIAGKKPSAIVAIMWKKNDFLAILTITAIIWKPAYTETAQRSKSPRPLNFLVAITWKPALSSREPIAIYE